jgi:hypothetical protein
MVEPIKPDEVSVPKPEIPDFVITAFNTLIQKKWNGEVAIISQNEAVNEIKKLMPDSYKESDIFDNHWLDVEDLFLAAGWDVIFHKRHYYDPEEDYYKFCKPLLPTVLNS